MRKVVGGLDDDDFYKLKRLFYLCEEENDEYVEAAVHVDEYRATYGKDTDCESSKGGDTKDEVVPVEISHLEPVVRKTMDSSKRMERLKIQKSTDQDSSRMLMPTRKVANNEGRGV